jgi:hypothetical protein
MADFSKFERKIIKLFRNNPDFDFETKQYHVLEIGKPISDKGEPKTDIFALAIDDGGVKREFKISLKQFNADFLENKVTKERAQEILGVNWKKIISLSLKKIRGRFTDRPLIYKSSYGKTEKGSITLGWKFELLNKSGGRLSGRLALNRNQIVEVLKGNNLSSSKKNALVNGKSFKNSGVADYILTSEMDQINSVDDILLNLVKIDDFIAETKPNIFFACKALNYRSLYQPKPKWDGDRPLAVFINWHIFRRKLRYNIDFDHCLEKRGNEIAANLRKALSEIEVRNTDELDPSMVYDSKIIYQK